MKQQVNIPVQESLKKRTWNAYYKAHYIKIAQIIITLILLSCFFLYIDKTAIVDILMHCKLSYLMFTCLLLVMQVTIAAYRWLKILQLNNFSLPAAQCIKYFAMSGLINTIIPSGVGGDVTRMWLTSRNGIPFNIATYSVIVDRIITLVGLGLLVTINLILFAMYGSEVNTVLNSLALYIGIILLTSFAGLILIAPVISYVKLQHVVVISPLVNLSHKIGKMFSYPSKLLILTAITLAGHGLLIISIVTLALALHTALPIQAIFIGLPIVLLFASIPITPGGWGMREGSMVFILGHFHISTATALGISILFGLGSIFANLQIVIYSLVHNTRKEKSLINLN